MIGTRCIDQAASFYFMHLAEGKLIGSLCNIVFEWLHILTRTEILYYVVCFSMITHEYKAIEE